jgi:hypothetical protein
MAEIEKERIIDFIKRKFLETKLNIKIEDKLPKNFKINTKIFLRYIPKLNISSIMSLFGFFITLVLGINIFLSLKTQINTQIANTSPVGSVTINSFITFLPFFIFLPIIGIIIMVANWIKNQNF